MFWPFGKKRAETGGRLSEIEQLILEADKSPSDEPRHRLWEALDRRGISQDEFYNIRTSLSTRLAKGGTPLLKPN